MRRASSWGLVIFLTACAGSSSGGATDHGSGGTTGAERGALPGNAAVRARLTALPTPPTPWFTSMGTVTIEQATTSS